MLTGALGVALFIFLAGIKRYRKQAPVKSPFTMVAQVFVAAMRKRRVIETQQGLGICYDAGGTDVEGQPGNSRTLAATNQYRYESIQKPSIWHKSPHLSSMATLK